jgi:hypothetical protein
MLWRVLVALFALLVMRIFFASMRHANSRGTPRRPDPNRGPGSRTAGTPRGRGAAARGAPRIDRSTAEDVPFVEVETERATRG